MTAGDKESALSRWSRRKHEVQQEPLETALLEAGQSPAAAAPAEVEAEAKPVLTDADMPALESLDENSDFSVFMSEGVSDKLRNLALRKLFKAPVFNIRDGLDEYDEDYTYFEELGDIVTCDMKHQIEMQEQKRREAAELEAREAEVDEQADAELEEMDDLDASEEIEDDDDSPDPTETVATVELQPEPENRQQKVDE